MTQPALQSILMPNREAIFKPGTMCPVRTVDNPGMTISHKCVDVTIPPCGRLMVSGSTAVQIFSMGVPAMTKMEVAPVSAMAWDGWTVNVTSRGMADAALCCVGDTFDATTVTLSISLLLMGSKAYFVISFNL